MNLIDLQQAIDIANMLGRGEDVPLMIRETAKDGTTVLSPAKARFNDESGQPVLAVEFER